MASISKRVSGAWQNTSYGIRATATDTITTLPTTIYSDGTNATVSIKGNTTQTGTPTPTTPIQPSECGDRTENLWDISQVIANSRVINQGNFLKVMIPSTSTGVTAATPNTLQDYCPTLNIGDEVTLSFETTGSTKYIYLFGENITWASGQSKTITATMLSSIIIWYASGTDTEAIISNIMLNTGSTALPYEPYGYKIPILSADTTTNNYLGEVETTRKIKKLVLDGTETITEESTNVYSIPITDTVTTGTGLSTHFEYDSTVSDGQFRIEAGKAVFGYNDTLANFSTFLATQYAAGTPVTLWYVLAESETSIVNEPLMKIDSYADEVNNISIPTTDGANTLSVDTTVQPSEVSINYHGWHMGTVHERTAGQWD